ncbi:hypothetical protein [Paenibacillus sp. FSL H7-689]|uniref:hypothetical protein n=1 Tax=Paenibacillus sp. FSL H7-689 TaxID=1227349 RepID=UPI0003E2AA94|nr:hypothetical protein [Paenibacillus sp. FSL H7-689]ETT44732.1 hypothetical protein C170_22560 [Paenibacillus sp. FSL H7-689]
MASLMIKYIQPDKINDHIDPNFTFLTYGDSDPKKIQAIERHISQGSYVFFHTSYKDQAFITAYFYVEKVLTRNENANEIDCLRTDSSNDQIVILGNREHSKILTFPLPFDKRVVDNLPSLNINWNHVTSGRQSES